MITKEAFDSEFRRFEKEGKEILGENFNPLDNYFKEAFWRVCEFRNIKFMKGTFEKALGHLRKQHEEKIR